jgi:site-specific DNA-methyltransferase (adenine-specific)
MKYNPQGLEDTYAVWAGKSGSAHRPKRKKQEEYVQTKTGYPRMVIDFPKDNNKGHPTKKPVALLEYLVRTYSNEGEIVLDNCMGSGSTGVASSNTGRRFIGIELDENYFDTAKKRIEETIRMTC